MIHQHMDTQEYTEPKPFYNDEYGGHKWVYLSADSSKDAHYANKWR